MGYFGGGLEGPPLHYNGCDRLDVFLEDSRCIQPVQKCTRYTGQAISLLVRTGLRSG